MPETLVELLQGRAQTNPDRLVYRMLRDGSVEEATYTYAQLDAEARRIAGLLLAALRPGEPAVVCHQPGLDYIASFFGCLYAGVTPVPVYPPRANASLERLEAIVEDVGAGAALLPGAAHEALAARIENHPGLRRLRWLSTTGSGAPSAAVTLPTVRPGDLALIQYTSGSTSQPKGVMLSHANLMANLEVIREKFECTEDDHGVFWLPPYHDMGLIGGILQAPLSNLVTTLMSPYAFLQRPLRWLQAISQYKGTISGAPNFAYDYCLRRIPAKELAALDLSSWRLAFCGAEPIDAKVLSRFATALAPAGFRADAMYPCYGLAESTLMVSGGKPGRPLRRITASVQGIETERAVKPATAVADERDYVGCGTGASGHRVFIVDPESGQELGDRQVGEICVTGPSVAQGYWRNPEETAMVFQPHLRTGDLGFLIEGEVFISGRLKDLIIVHGRNVYPQDLERTVGQSHPAFLGQRTAVFALPASGPGKPERIGVVQEVDRHAWDEKVVSEAVQKMFEAVFAQHEVSLATAAFVRLRSIPLTSSGKVQRRLTRTRFLDNSLEELHRHAWEA